MALRSPTEHHAYWGVYATAGDLPNVAGSPTQSASLEAGDQAYCIAAQNLYVCTVSTLGAASWSPCGGGGGGAVPLIIPLGGVMGDSFGTWNTAGGVEINWADYAGSYSTWQYTAITVCSGAPFVTEAQLFDQTNVNQLALVSSASTTPVATTIALGAVPVAGSVLYLSQVQITSSPPVSPSPSDRAVLLSSFLTLKP